MSDMRELMTRSGDGLTVTLEWSEVTGPVVTVTEGSGPDALTQAAQVPPAEALQAFSHPYVYLPRESDPAACVGTREPREPADILDAFNGS